MRARNKRAKKGRSNEKRDRNSTESLSVIARVVVRLSSRSRSHSKLTGFFRPEPEKVLSVNSETGRYSTESFTGVALWFRCLMYDHRPDLCLVEQS